MRVAVEPNVLDEIVRRVDAVARACRVTQVARCFADRVVALEG